MKLTIREPKRKLFLCFLIVATILQGCDSGGGGGGSNFEGAARVNLKVAPNKIDTGDRAQVSIEINNVIDDGIILKVRYPIRLSYASETAKLKLASESFADPVSPSFNGVRNDWNYLVFFLPREAFGDFSEDENIRSEKATLTFQVIGDGRISKGRIEADADVNNPNIPDNLEFNIDDPMFEAETEGSIEVTQSRD